MLEKNEIILEETVLKQEMKNAINWIKEYINKVGTEGIVVGNSGGKDSAVVLAMTANVIGKENIVSVYMPCFSTNEDLEDPQGVSKTFGTKMINVDLSNTYLEMEETIQKSLGMYLSKEAGVNSKPRLRMTTLYAITQTLGYLVIGTRNLCEAMVGYTTKWGDNSSDFNPIANFTVSEVLQIGKWLGVSERVLNKEPNDGLGGQQMKRKWA